MAQIVYRNYQPLSQRRVFKLSVAIHTLGQQFANDNSENHVTINCLLGAGLSVRIDMQLANDENLGRLLLEGRDQTRSDTMIHNVDVKARGCPSGFNPAAQPPNVACPTVQQLVDLITNLGFYRFRFLYVEGHSDGCRHWVWAVLSAFLTQGYLAREESLESLKSALAQKWDRSRQPTPWTIVPGLFVQERTPCGKQHMASLLVSADPRALKMVAQACVASREGDERLPDAIGKEDQAQRQAVIILTMNTTVEDRDCEITMDLFSSPSTWPTLASTFNGRYSLAVQAIGAAMSFYQMSAESHRQTILAFLLTAVIDMSGAPD